MPKIEYSQNNSGGSWWLDDKDWDALQAAGWDVSEKPMRADKDFPSLEDAVAEWERLTGQDSKAEGCECCGRPHYFWATWSPPASPELTILDDLG